MASPFTNCLHRPWHRKNPLALHVLAALSGHFAADDSGIEISVTAICLPGMPVSNANRPQLAYAGAFRRYNEVNYDQDQEHN